MKKMKVFFERVMIVAYFRNDDLAMAKASTHKVEIVILKKMRKERTRK